ncbi:Putative succinate dehydrogenase [ubiquinone] cytochrome b small subunit, mitochondrial [Trachymyrmex septentrionalis]|uniref:Succinate dehydrogenase [ubiquinone] cytochrome b small subunit n=1 Tax=Trachymyrmex septentrionalis TaxID=34720 RepID=A0A195FJI8_9HYME|nr:PREDICTED: succinate dehydrogenase [ubiquinone] cytochrome b small subunit, mitochondrial [Trachymyrmex septentrionalis]KYN40422.1 Putative succinate dehydrogenase [ubiquinone] cytochrome b small subunit, mitochondrial [Trachymyrmex septentrionalis]
MNFGRIANINVFRKIRQLETLIKPGGLLVRSCPNPTQFPKSTSSLANLNRSVIPNASNYPKCNILSKLSVQSTVSMTQTRAASTHGDHVRLWIIEKIVSVSFLPLLPAALLFENKFIDIVLAAAIVIHTHWGLEAIIIDYARPIVVGTLFPKVAFLMLNILSVVTLAGLFVLIYNGPGLTKTIKSGWAISKNR